MLQVAVTRLRATVAGRGAADLHERRRGARALLSGRHAGDAARSAGLVYRSLSGRPAALVAAGASVGSAGGRGRARPDAVRRRCASICCGCVRRCRPPDRQIALARSSTPSRDARLLVVGGAGGVADHFGDYSNLVLLALQCARRRGIPTAIMGHGFGPLTAPHLRAKAAAVLPKVDSDRAARGASVATAADLARRADSIAW